MDEILRKFKESGRAAFRTREYGALLGKGAYARLVLHRLKERGELVLIRRGWWSFPGSSPEAIACEISKPAYLSFHSALYAHGLTTQMPRAIQLAVARNGRTYGVLGSVVKEYKISRASFRGFTSREGIPLATKEKAFADCLGIPRACPRVILAEAAGGVDLDAARELVSSAGRKRLERLLKDAKPR